MTLKDITLVMIFSVAWTYHVQGISYSKVYVHGGGSDPVDFVKYGAPGVYTDAQIARLSAPPIGSVLPLPSGPNVIPPCVSPCVLPDGNIASAVPVASNAKIITYNAPSLPVVVAPSKDNGYEYSYVVYDENTGDQKAQRESSDGAVVRGEYSFIQPDGFNAVVKKILPDSIGRDKGKKKPEAKEKKEPCEPAKKEALKTKPELTDRGYNENAQDIEVNIAKPAPTKAPEKKEPKPKEAVTSKPEPENPKTVVPLNKKEEGPKVNKETSVAPAPIDSRGVVAYDDIIRCLQSKIQRPQGLYSRGVSPLTYIIIPGGGPC